MSDPQAVPVNALEGMTIALSVSESADLGRLGLSPQHAELVVAELGRAVILSGGKVAYGGRLMNPRDFPASRRNFTDILIDEVLRYADQREALTIYVPASEHVDIDQEELEELEERLKTSARVLVLDLEGAPSKVPDREAPSAILNQQQIQAGLSAMRRTVTEVCDARIIVGGKLSGYQGRIPGVIEEATLTLGAGKPLLAAGGFGGASAAVARALGYDDFAWAPPHFPLGADDQRVVDGLAELRQAAGGSADRTGLNATERAHLASSHRPGDIATLVVTGLARMRGTSG